MDPVKEKDLLQQVLGKLIDNPLAAAERMEELAAQLLEGVRRLRGEAERMRSQGGASDRVTIEVVRVQPTDQPRS